MLAKLARWLGRDGPAWRQNPPAFVRSSSARSLPPVPQSLHRAAQQATLERLRSPMREHDLSLSLEARLWLLRLPPALQPHALCRDHPRLANRLAAEWQDASAIEARFDDLLHDRRGGRRGFAEPVRRELRRLMHFSVRYRQLTEARRDASLAASDASADTLPMPLGGDGDDGIDWTPTETIVVRDGR